MKIFKREKRKLELYLEKLEIDMANQIDSIKEIINIDAEYVNEIENAKKIAAKIQETKFEILLLKKILNETKEDKNV